MIGYGSQPQAGSYHPDYHQSQQASAAQYGAPPQNQGYTANARNAWQPGATTAVGFAAQTPSGYATQSSSNNNNNNNNINNMHSAGYHAQT